jgi:hypothetical protein
MKKWLAVTSGPASFITYKEVVFTIRPVNLLEGVFLSILPDIPS